MFHKRVLENIESSLEIKVYRQFSSKKRHHRIPQNIVTDLKNGVNISKCNEK